MTNTTADISAGTATSTSATASQSPTEQPLIMQLIIDRNLIGDPHWTLGPLLAQASHATAAIIARTLPTCPQTQEYVSSENLPNMHKVTLKTASKGAGADLRELSKKLDEAKSELGNDFPEHHLWIEQPENIPTCIAIAPNRKPQVSWGGSLGGPAEEQTLTSHSNRLHRRSRKYSTNARCSEIELSLIQPSHGAIA